MSDMKKGNISIHAENIMPVIKRWLYSDKDIFIRELTANGCDAVTKYRMIAGDDEDLRVTVTVDTEAKELRFTDNGIGMTAEEVDRYINQVAFSSAEEFLKKYQGDKDGGIIGHFGLGFYSAFMPADKVTIDTLSYQEGAKAVRWESEDGMAYEMSDSDRAERGTTVTLHITDEEKEFLDSLRVREVLERYCGYMAVPIYLVDVQDEKLKAEEAEKAAKEAAEKGEAAPAPKAAEPINDTHPLWLKNPRDCTEEEYKDTYRKLFHTFEEPLFWIHLNVDYPFNLKGILYFPRIRKDFGGQEGQIKLFNRQVFVADNIKEIIPEFLLLLRALRLHTVADRNDDIEIIVIHLISLTVSGSCCKICNNCFSLQFALSENVLDMSGNGRLVSLKQLRHLVNGQPNGISIKGRFDPCQAILCGINHHFRIILLILPALHGYFTSFSAIAGAFAPAMAVWTLIS